MVLERLVSAERQPHDSGKEIGALRPVILSEMVGQGSVTNQLQIALQGAAKQRSEPIEHVLLDGPPGLGKTTLAFIIAQEMTGRPPRMTSGPVLNKTADLMSLLTNLEQGEVLFIDEIHRMPRIVEEFLYPAMEDFRVDYTIDGGVGGRTINFNLNQFTLIGATTRAGMLSSAFRDRFGLRFHFEFYRPEELAEIIRRCANRLDVGISERALEQLAARSRGTPRVAQRLLRRVRDFAQVRGHGTVEADVLGQALELLGIDRLGLDDLDRAFLQTMITVYKGGPIGIEALAATMGQERETLEDVVEPYLLQLGFVIRTKQGRQAAQGAYEHLGLTYPEPTPQSQLF